MLSSVKSFAAGARRGRVPGGALGWRAGRAARRVRAIGLGAALLLLPGCGTLITQVDGPLFSPGDRTFDWDRKPASPIYSGTRLSWGGVRKSEVYYVWIVDLPLSFVADTGILPLSLVQELLFRVFGVVEEDPLEPRATGLPPE